MCIRHSTRTPAHPRARARPGARALAPRRQEAIWLLRSLRPQRDALDGLLRWAKDEDEVARWWQMLAGVVRKARPDPAVPLLLFVDSNLPVGDVLSEAVGGAVGV